MRVVSPRVEDGWPTQEMVPGSVFFRRVSNVDVDVIVHVVVNLDGDGDGDVIVSVRTSS
jgi:hypothetical protein